MDDCINMDFVVVKKKLKTGLGRNNVFLNEDFVLMPLYKKIKIDNKLASVEVFPYNDFRLELYCPECKKRRIFNFENSSFVGTFYDQSGNLNSTTISNVFTKYNYLNFKAKGDCNHNLYIVIKVMSNDEFMKVGQYPSIYDLNEEINDKPFLKELGSENSSYYKNACSLYSFNACIGAMVYLRRIFEGLLTECFDDNTEELELSFDDFQHLRMEDKIKTLRKFLPELIFETGFNRIYKKISDGIHNLTEDECQLMFPILKSALEEILIQKVEEKDKEKRRKELSNKLNVL